LSFQTRKESWVQSDDFQQDCTEIDGPLLTEHPLLRDSVIRVLMCVCPRKIQAVEFPLILSFMQWPAIGVHFFPLWIQPLHLQVLGLWDSPLPLSLSKGHLWAVSWGPLESRPPLQAAHCFHSFLLAKDAGAFREAFQCVSRGSDFDANTVPWFGVFFSLNTGSEHTFVLGKEIHCYCLSSLLLLLP